MSLPVLVGFAGVLVAAVTTGLLAGRCAREPRIHFILWTAATLALTVALAAQSMGFDRGFGAATFRAVQLAALLLAPLWLGWGLVELVAGSEAVRFGTRLVSAALIVVAAVILVTDPLTAQPAGTSWPSAGSHFQPVALYALDAVQVVAVLAAGASELLAALRARRDSRWRSALPGVAAVGLAVLMTAGLRAAWPDRSVYPLLGLLAAALVWFGAVRTQPQPPQASASAAARPYGRILIFTLLDDRVTEFDRHESQPYMRRFLAGRRSCVLATNVIELRLAHAKVAQLALRRSVTWHPVNASCCWPSLAVTCATRRGP
jgi:hypothetical protein